MVEPRGNCEFDGSTERPLLREGETCRRVARAERLAVLVDGDVAFRAVAEAFRLARRTIRIVGWDLDSRLRLIPEGPDATPPLGRFLRRLLRARPELQVEILTWELSALLALERASLPTFRLAWRPPPRFSFRYDDAHPVGAAAHQKIVTVDDSVAFVGGLDLTLGRWDTEAHPVRDARRRVAGGRTDAPFHDCMAVVSGPAAAALADEARDRWTLATGRRPAGGDGGDGGDVGPAPWPKSVEPELRDVAVGVARTLPEHEGRSGVREVERLFLESIRAARRMTYVESQYLTSNSVGDALAASLARSDGPEILVVGPDELFGALEQATVGLRRARLVERLRGADRHGRLRVVHPVLPNGAALPVHAKVMIVDDRLARIGSANLANRSMAVDTECDLAVEADDVVTSRWIRRLTARMLAHHLGRATDEVAESISAHGLLAAAAEPTGGGRRLADLDDRPEEWSAVAEPLSRLADPERVLGADEILESFLAGAARRLSLRWRLAAHVASLLVLALAWTVAPLDGAVLPATSGGTALLATVAVAVGSLVLPTTLVATACGMVLPPAVAVFVAVVGCLLGTTLAWAAGRGGRSSPARLSPALRRWLRERSAIELALLRLVPVAPAPVLALLAAEARVPLGRFLPAGAAGLLATVPFLVLAGHGLARWLVQPTPLGAALVAVAVVGLLVLGGVARRTLTGRLAARRR